MTSLESSFQAENGLNLEGDDEAAVDPVLSIESSLNEINPIKPAVLELPDEVIYQGIVSVTPFTAFIHLSLFRLE